MKYKIEFVFNVSLVLNTLLLLNYIFKWIDIPHFMIGFILVFCASVFFLNAYFFKKPVQNK
jgi:hypothetical protein